MVHAITSSILQKQVPLSCHWYERGFCLFIWIFVLLKRTVKSTTVYFPQSYSWPSWCWKCVFLSALLALGCPFPLGVVYQAIFCSVIYQTVFSKQNPSQMTVSYLLKVSSQLTIVGKAKIPGPGSRIWAKSHTLLISWCSLKSLGGLASLILSMCTLHCVMFCSPLRGVCDIVVWEMILFIVLMSSC